MTPPLKFDSDLQSRTLNIVCRVIIESSENIYLSTHKMNFDGNYYKPLLLKTPTIRRSIGISDRKFKISNVDLSISNIEQNGEIFSDILSTASLINARTRIFFQTQTATTSDDSFEVYVGSVGEVIHNKSEVSIKLEDYTQQKLNIELPTKKVATLPSTRDKYKNKPIPMVYGHVDKAPAVLDAGRIKADSTPVDLVTIGGIEPNDDYFAFGGQHAKYEPTTIYYHDVISPFHIYSGGTYVNIPMKGLHSFEETIERLFPPRKNEEGVIVNRPPNYFGINQWTYEWANGLKISNNWLTKKGVIQGVQYNKAGGVSCTKRTSITNYLADIDTGFDNPDNFGEDVRDKLSDDDYAYFNLSDINGFDPSHTWEYNFNNLVLSEYDIHVDENFGINYEYDFVHNVNGNFNQNLIRLKIDVAPEFNAIGYNCQLAMNGHRFPLLDDDQLMMQTINGEFSGEFMTGCSHIFIANAMNNATQSGFDMAVDVAQGSAFSSIYQVYNLLFSIANPFYINEYLMGGSGEVYPFSGVALKNIFKFPDVQENADYGGYMPEAPEYDDLISIYNTSVTFKGSDLDSGTSDVSEVVDYIPYIQMQANIPQGYLALFFGLNFNWHDGPDQSEQDPTTILYNNYEFTMSLGGKWSEIDLKTTGDIEHGTRENFYLNVDGRRRLDVPGNVLRNPIEIISDLARREYFPDEILMPIHNHPYIDYDSYENALSVESDMEFAFSVDEVINGKDLLEEIAKSTLCFPHFNRSGKLAFPSISPSYSYEDYDNAFVIKEQEILGYSFSKTPREELYTSYNVEYKYDYETKEYSRRVSDSILYDSSQPIGTLDMDLIALQYYGYEFADENILEFETKYIRDLDTAKILQNRLFQYYRNQHLITKIKLPLHYLGIDIGAIIKFDKLIQDDKSYGIDYTKVTNFTSSVGDSNGQFYYPLFFVSSMRINYDYIEIEATQLHYLSTDLNINDIGNWESAGLLSYGAYQQDEIEEGIETLIEDSFTIDPNSSNSFYTLEELYSSNISNWIEPISWVLDSFDSLVPTDWTSYTANEIKNYEALHLSIAYELSGSFARNELILKNISNSTDPNDFELGWVSSAATLAGQTVEDWFGQYEGSGHIILHYYSGYASSNRRHQVLLGDGLKKAFDNNLLDFEEITFYSWYPIMLHTWGHALGDVNGDSVVNILDTMAMVNVIMGSAQWEDYGGQASEDAADANQDGTASILDVVAIHNYILGQGDLG